MNSIDTEIAIIGAGPAGLAVADTLQAAGHEVVLFDRGAVGQAVAEYPTFMTYFSTRELLELGGLPMTIASIKPTRQEYLVYLNRFVQSRGLDVRTYVAVESLERDVSDPAHPFRLRLMSSHHGAGEARARFVVIANGSWDHPNRLAIPGDDLPKVSYRYTEPYPYIGRRVLVVGGRSSAIETALDLWRNGATVDLSYRRTSFEGRGVKYWLRPDIENRLKNGEIHDHLGTIPVEFRPDSVRLRKVDTGEEYDIPNDFVFAMTGYMPDFSLLRGAGIEIDEATGTPRHDPETYESNVPGLFLAGVILQGNISGHIFIENSREHGGPILRGVARRAAAAVAAKALV
jgi:thioredoxin reductase (NADPH)